MQKNLWKPSKHCHVGIHLKALAEYSQMSTHMPGFQSFSSFFCIIFVSAKLATSSIRVNWKVEVFLPCAFSITHCKLTVCHVSISHAVTYRWGIRRGLVVTMPGSQAWVRRFESPLDPQAGLPGRYINLRRCGGLSMVLPQPEDPLE